jgi:4'-phosphopantetheinyl transferase
MTPLPADHWSPPPPQPRLEHGRVDVWLAEPPRDAARLATHVALLAPDELVRAARFLRPADEHRFVASRVLLRSLLGRYLDTPPRALVLTKGRYGKPRLADAGAPGFNVAHSGRAILVAIATAPDVGVDVELVRADVDVDLLAASHFAPAERAALARLAPTERRAAFFRLWARKEAYVKALGTGFSTEPSTFAVALDEARVLAAAPGHPAGWSLADCGLGEDYAGAVAVPEPGWRVARFDARAEAPWSLPPPAEPRASALAA